MNKTYKYLYGPVPSRRLGKSLGVSPIPPKTCNYSCVYCQIGRTTHFSNTREDFFPKEDILAEIEHFIRSTNDFDYITFVGEGEPTLCKSLGWLIRSTKKLTKKPVAVITNGALLYDPETRYDLLEADVVLPTLDAASQELFKKINRSKKEIDKLGCDRVYVNVPIRPPAEQWVHIPENDRVVEICKELNAHNIAHIAHYESDEGFQINVNEDIEDQILKITTRHPLRETQIIAMFDLPLQEITQILSKMSKDGMIKRVEHNNQVFWLNANSKIKSMK